MAVSDSALGRQGVWAPGRARRARRPTGWRAPTLKWCASIEAPVSHTPSDLLYTKSHEWVQVEGDIATIGITDHAQKALNDIVFVELPNEGDHFDQEDGFGVVESVKSVSDLYMPVAGEVIEVNRGLEDAPETLNEDPYGAGWLIKVRMDDRAEAKGLLSAEDYLDEIA
jgi:glycine cleavage system H protein